MSKHTPGPWKADKNRHVYPADFSNYDKDPICKVYTDNETRSAMFNAHLIAAAPEMLEVLEELYDRYGDDDPLLHRTMDIIDKAKGLS